MTMLRERRRARQQDTPGAFPGVSVAVARASLSLALFLAALSATSMPLQAADAGDDARAILAARDTVGRAATVRRLRALGAEALPGLIESLFEAPEPEFSGGFGASEAVADGYEALVVEALQSFDVRAVEAAIVAVAAEREAFHDKLTCVRVLGRAGDGQAFGGVLTILAAADAAYVHSPAAAHTIAAALGELVRRDPGAAAWVRGNARELPDHLAPVVAGALGSHLRRTSVPALAALLGRSTALDLVVLEQLARLDVRDAALHTEEAAQVLRPYLGSDDREVRRQAMVSLGRLRDANSIEFFITLLGDDDPGVRRGALHALRDVTGLSWNEEPDPWRTWLAAQERWLAEEWPRVTADLASRDSAVVLAAIRAAAAHPLWADRVAPALCEVLWSGDSGLASTALTVLASLRSPASLPDLVEALRHDDESLRASAHATLRAMTGLDLPDQHGEWSAWLAG